MNDEKYTIADHTHRFGLWTAARAASKSLLSNKEIKGILEDMQLRIQVDLLRQEEDLTVLKYQEWFKGQCDTFKEKVKQLECKDIKKERISHGLAAKVISIYIKTVEVIPSKGLSTLSEVAFPPIDSILLKKINKVNNLSLDVIWSKYTWEQYIETIDKIVSLDPLQLMWKIESNWDY